MIPIAGLAKGVAGVGMWGSNFGLAGHGLEVAGHAAKLLNSPLKGMAAGTALGAAKGYAQDKLQGPDENGRSHVLGSMAQGALAGTAIGTAGRFGADKALLWAGGKSRGVGTKMDNMFNAAMKAGPGVDIPFIKIPGKKVPTTVTERLPSGISIDKVVEKRQWNPYRLTAGKALNMGGNALLMGEAAHLMHQAVKGQQPGGAEFVQTPPARIPQTQYPLGSTPNHDLQLKQAAARDFQILLAYAEEHYGK